MKILISLLWLAVVTQGTKPHRTTQKIINDEKFTHKRALAGGNSRIERIPEQRGRQDTITNTDALTPGIVYTDNNRLQADKSLEQSQFLATAPQPPLSKISDLLTSHDHHFQAAIANHLYSPVSLYQTKVPGYEVSAPIPSRLAYTENITYTLQPPQQLNPQSFKTTQKPDLSTPKLIRVTYPEPTQLYEETNFQELTTPSVQPQPQIYPPQQYQPPQFIQLQSFQPQLAPLPYTQQPFQYQSPIQFTQQTLPYVQEQPPASVQPGISYIREEDSLKPNERETTLAQTQAALQKIQEEPEQNFNAQNQGAVSYASFSIGPPEPKPIRYNIRAENKSSQHYQFQPQNQVFHKQIHLHQPKHKNYQIERQPLSHFSQIINRAKTSQYQRQNQQLYQQILSQKPELPAENYVREPGPSSENYVNLSYKKPFVTENQQTMYPVLFYPQLNANQVNDHIFSKHKHVLNHLSNERRLAVSTYPPVQYFDKFSQEFFESF